MSARSKEEESPRLIHIRLTPELHRALRVRAAEDDVSIQDWVASLIERTLLPAAKGKRK